MGKFASSVIELSESALQNNISFLKSQLNPNVKFSSVIKGNAYGHGIEVFVPMAEKCGIRHFSTFSANEAFHAWRSLSEPSGIMIMGDMEEDSLGWAIENNIEFYIFDLERLKRAHRLAIKTGKKAQIHIELETGLNRTGLDYKSLQSAVDFLKDNRDYFEIKGICTHYAGAETVSNYLRIQNQIESFKEQCKWLRSKGIKSFARHSACSAATLTYPETQMDMVRIGIAQYGYWSSQETQMLYYLRNGVRDKKKIVDPLKRIIKWKSRITAVKEVEPGEFIGYGTHYLTQRKQRIASVPVGYSHGFARSLSNLGRVLVRGRRASVVGVVNMNMMMVDVSNIPDAEIHDEVVIIGRQKKLQISVASFSDMTNYLNYEVLVRLPSEIPRVVVK